MRLLRLGIFAALTTSLAYADLEEVVVTAAKLSGGYDEMPAATITKSADFLVQKIRFVNDSRSPDLRKKEILSTIDGMLKQAIKQKNIALSYGEGFLVPVNLTDESLQIIEDKRKTDTSFVDVFVKVTLTAADDTKTQISTLKKFIESSQRIGRTEIESQGDVGLSIVNPEKYRYEILAKIAEENTRLSKAMGQKCQAKVGGLEGRVQWARTDVAKLTLYIPYGLEVSQCVFEQ